MTKKLLVIGLVWPEPTSSAAGTRILQLLDFFLSEGYQITFSCAAQRTDFSFPLESLGINTIDIRLNDSDFDAFVKELNPNTVLFDRYITEEQFGWRVADAVPNAVRILDTEDLHCLRAARESCVKKGIPFEEVHLLQSPVAIREVAAIYRCDLSLMISRVEIRFLTGLFGVPEDRLLFLPFLYPEVTETIISGWPDFTSRQDFLFIGNFRHYPNLHALQYLKTDIWPLIRASFPEAVLRAYGAYTSPEVSRFDDPASGFHIMGRAESVSDVMRRSRVLLAPLRIGAGQKGKLAEAMQHGLPSVTTSIGAEGMTADRRWGGYVADDPERFAQLALELYHRQECWEEKQREGIDVFRSLNVETSKTALRQRVQTLHSNLPAHRAANFVGRMLTHHTMSSYKYLSRWIEEKEKRQS